MRIVALMAAMVLVASLQQGALAVEIIGHRGASEDAPENTAASVRLAYEQGADAAEIDVQLTKDGRIVCLHDDDTERTAGPKWKVAERTFDELRNLDAGAWKDAEYAGEKIPALEEILAVVPRGKRLFIEIKCGPEIVPELERILNKSARPPEETPIIGFDLETVKAADSRMPERPVYWLFGTSPKRDKKTGRVSDWPDELLDRCRDAGLDGLDLKYDGQLTDSFVKRLHVAGLKLYVWTVNDQAEAARLVGLGVDGITTDRPGWLRQQLMGGK